MNIRVGKEGLENYLKILLLRAAAIEQFGDTLMKKNAVFGKLEETMRGSDLSTLGAGLALLAGTAHSLVSGSINTAIGQEELKQQTRVLMRDSRYGEGFNQLVGAKAAIFLRADVAELAIQCLEDPQIFREENFSVLREYLKMNDPRDLKYEEFRP